MNTKWTSLLLAGVIGIACASATFAQQQPAESPPKARPGQTTAGPNTDEMGSALDPALDAWGQQMANTPLPGAWCYKVTYPSVKWEDADPYLCGYNYPENKLPASRTSVSAQKQVGNGTGWYLQAPAGFISQAVGSFPSMSNVTSVESTYPGSVTVPESFSVQLNTNTAPTRCAGIGECTLWQQFTLNVYMQDEVPVLQLWYWATGQLYPYTISTGIPDRTTHTGSLNDRDFLNIHDLPYIKIYGNVGRDNGKGSKTLDAAILQHNDNMYAITVDTTQIGMPWTNMSTLWNAVEVNVFGRAPEWFNANFNSRAQLTVKAGAWYDNYQNGIAPTCGSGSPASNTGMPYTNNLYLGYCQAAGFDNANPDSYPYIQFEEAFVPPPVITSPKDGDSSTNQFPLVAGEGAAGSMIYVTLDEEKQWCRTAVLSENTWTCPSKQVSPGKHTIYATQSQSLGNSAPAAVSFEITQ